MKRHKVVLLGGTYNISNPIKVPSDVTILGFPVTKSAIFWRVLRWIQSIWRKPPVIWLQMYKQRDTSERVGLVVVAATDSSDEDKARANLVCSGINDEQEIQAALDCHDGTIKVPGVSIT